MWKKILKYLLLVMVVCVLNQWNAPYIKAANNDFEIEDTTLVRYTGSGKK